jgi:hypothetical protein
MNASVMSQNVGLRPSKAFSGNVTGLERSAKVQQRMIARPVTAMASAAMEEVPTPEKRVSPPPNELSSNRVAKQTKPTKRRIIESKSSRRASTLRSDPHQLQGLMKSYKTISKATNREGCSKDPENVVQRIARFVAQSRLDL